MDMLKHIYIGIFGVLLIGFAACSTEQLEEDNGLTPGTTPIQMMGAVTRAGDTNGNLYGYAGLYLSAKTDVNTDYFTNNAITVTSSEATKSVLDVHMNYPLDKDKTISLYGHSGEVTNGNISLTSGTDATNDALISNGTDGSGTAGSVNSPVSMLTFRHVMTKVTVKVEVNGSVEETKPTNIQIGFDDSKVAGSGKYALTATTNETATDISGSYTLEGSADGTDNYLVPTGEILSGAAGFIKSLKIDDYTATAEDCDALTIPQADLNGTLSDLILKPGLAYTLTFKIKRLKVVGIALTMKEWDIKTGDGEWGYDPYKVKMNVAGGYSNSDDKLISKIVLHYTPSSGQSETYQYIGTGVADGSDAYAHFVTLPKADKMTDGTLKADLYTRNGLLIVGHEVKFKEADTSFDINLGSNGMVIDVNGYHQVTTPLQFYNMMSNPEAGTKYRLTENIDINSLPLAITPTAFPTGAELDGNGKSILHLKLKGSGLFTINNGTLKNIHSSFCSIDASESSDPYVGGLCSINNGIIEGCINEADIKTNELQIAGGICGKNNDGGKILACLNTGNIPAGDKIGGICGENANPVAGAITACISAGMLHGSSNHHVDSDIGGICGYQSIAKTSGAVINACFWLTGTSRPAQGSSDEKAIGSFGNGITPLGDYCINTTNMTETLLRTEAVIKLNDALTGKGWKFEWDKNSDGTYKTVWPMPVKNTTTP